MEKSGDRAVAYLRARTEVIERRIDEIFDGDLDGIVDEDSRQLIADSYIRELEMYRYMLDAVMLKARIHTTEITT